MQPGPSRSVSLHKLFHIGMTGLALLLLLGLPRSGQAQTQVEVREAGVEYIFGQELTIQASVLASQPVVSGLIFVRPKDGSTNAQAGQVTVSQLAEGEYSLGYSQDLTTQSLRAFSPVEYHFELTLQDGQIYQSPKLDFFYEDNRFRWEVRELAPFVLHWHQGDLVFAQSVLDVAQDGLARVQNLLALPTPERVDIYLYSSASEMQETLSINREMWVAGHADPDLGVMVVTIPPGPDQHLLMEQRIPHELMHILLYQATQPGYANLPTWLNEGLASIAELYPNPDYQVLLENAYRRDSLLPIASLCPTFPRDASNALLAYAQAASFTRYLYREYGTPGLQNLVNTYAGGVSCEAGMENALTESLQHMERQWRQVTFAENVTLSALGNLAPWIILLGAILLAPLAVVASNLRRKAGSQAG